MAMPGWDERDYSLQAKLMQLNSYGLIGRDSDNPMISRKEVIKLLQSAARERHDFLERETAENRMLEHAASKRFCSVPHSTVRPSRQAGGGRNDGNTE